MSHRPLLAVVLAALLAGTACQPPAAENLTDPREILGRTVAATSALRTVSLSGTLEIRDSNNPAPGPGGVTGGGAESQLSVETGEYSMRVVGADGVEIARIIAVGGQLFTSSGGPRWQQVPAAQAGLGNPLMLFLGGGAFANDAARPDVAAILGEAVLDPGVRAELTGVEDCAAGRCYRTTLDLPIEVLWPLAMRILGVDQVPGAAVQEPPPGTVPGVSISVLSDTSTLRLVELAGSASTPTVSARFLVQLGGHDGPVSIAAPPAELVDPGLIAPGQVAPGRPAPMPAQPVPMPAQPVPVPVQPVPPSPAPG